VCSISDKKGEEVDEKWNEVSGWDGKRREGKKEGRRKRGRGIRKGDDRRNSRWWSVTDDKGRQGRRETPG